ncbi:hypothetical protein PCANC_20440 [Puccinia coronata f. sp. avenae]|uniref:DUF6589 domain-containing protein n=1 Tax=Puccinia coronata f. sp. avenae TaxID=200324 RepID=A0A2N5SFL7_9BASI|nr:hypothetical protein PCANC_20440 [Puccinia coronata f. sp. avenae]
MSATSAAIRDTLKICQHLKDINMPIKEFVMLFLTGKHIELATRQRFWATSTGYESTLRLVECIRDTFEDLADSQGWILVRNNERLSRSSTGHFQSAQSVKPDFFSEAAKVKREEQIVQQEMPFLYGILMGMLRNNDEPPETDVAESDTCAGPNEPISVPTDTFEAQLLERDGITYVPNSGGRDQVSRRWHHLAATICAQLLFARNRRHNGLQLHNAICFLPCGVSERVNDYLHKLGLTSSRRTAIQALKTLSGHAAEDVKAVMSLERSPELIPFLCIDNLDIQEKVHTVSITDRSMMFHGTWGYVQLPSKALLDSLEKSERNLGAYQQAVQDVSTMQSNPSMFLPSHNDKQHYYHVMTSQFAEVMEEYVGFVSDKEGAISTKPPVLEQILPEIPTVFMLRLMDESDNSAEGIAQVLESIQRQTGLTPSKFTSRLQPMDGDLETIQNFNSLRDLRHPSSYPEHSFDNVIFPLGGAHTLRNIAQAILTEHLGDPSNKNNLGVWQSLEALGIPHNKVIQKKDFTLMLQQIEQVHKATLLHCIWVVMKTHKEKLVLKPQNKPTKMTTAEWNSTVEKWTIPTEERNSIIEECYTKFCLPQARRDVVKDAAKDAAKDVSKDVSKDATKDLSKDAAKENQPRLHNVLVCIHNFSTIIEAKNAMKAGDIGRLMNVWKMWVVMSQAIKSLKHYSAYLPSGRKDQFMAKDNFMEHQNYWLKHFFNGGGIETQIDCLKKLFSMNIFLL